ncbi:putative malate dehydrogenase (oxaloacetate-decarboxylating) (NADP(+)) [Helianthus debilis subsp. tardiflorus]
MLWRNSVKRLMVVRIVKHAMEIIHVFTDANPIQIILDAVINRNWPERNIQVIVVTDGERILGLGDLGFGKLALYTALGGVGPSACLHVTIDVGTNNQKLLDDEFYIGLRQKRATGKEYSDLLEEFMSAVNQNYGEKVLVQFEDFANHNAFELLAKYRTSQLVFNNDIQGTASVLLAGLVASLKLLGGSLADHTFLFLGARVAGTGIAELIALEISTKTSIPVEEARKKIWLVDSKGLIVSSRKGSLQHLKNKGVCGACWAFSTPGVLEVMQCDPSEKDACDKGCSGGLMTNAYGYLMKAGGIQLHLFCHQFLVFQVFLDSILVMIGWSWRIKKKYMEGDTGRDLGCQKTMDGKANEDIIPSCCLKARAFAPDPELQANCHATVVSGWFSESRSSSNDVAKRMYFNNPMWPGII